MSTGQAPASNPEQYEIDTLYTYYIVKDNANSSRSCLQLVVPCSEF
jgi:hypothetical protein